MPFIYGQNKVLTELEYLSKAKINRNILFIGNSGYGKNLIAEYLLYLQGIENKDVFYYVGMPPVLSFGKKKYVFLDEIHLIKEYEPLYPFMDSGEYFFVFATNLYDNLPEAFVRRCICFFLEPYSEDELIKIASDYFSDNNIKLSYEVLREIVLSSKDSPGFLVKLCERLVYIFKNSFLPKDKEETNEILNTFLGIKNGLDLQDGLYLTTLKNLGGVASLDRIIFSSNLPRKVVQVIESHLLKKGLIRISSKGRTYVGQ